MSRFSSRTIGAILCASVLSACEPTVNIPCIVTNTEYVPAKRITVSDTTTKLVDIQDQPAHCITYLHTPYGPQMIFDYDLLSGDGHAKKTCDTNTPGTKIKVPVSRSDFEALKKNHEEWQRRNYRQFPIT